MKSIRTLGFGLAVAIGVPGLIAAVHPQGQLTLSSTMLTPGMTVHLTGTKFPKKEPLDVLLAGPSGRRQLKHIQADTLGSFHDFVVIPEGVAPGSYRIVLIASDDDEVAQVDVQIGAGTAPVAAAPTGDAAGHDMAHMEASAEALGLPRARSPWVTGGALVAIGLALAIGAAAVLRTPSA